jgi:hypothetical protein
MSLPKADVPYAGTDLQERSPGGGPDCVSSAFPPTLFFCSTYASTIRSRKNLNDIRTWSIVAWHVSWPVMRSNADLRLSTLTISPRNLLIWFLGGWNDVIYLSIYIFLLVSSLAHTKSQLGSNFLISAVSVLHTTFSSGGAPCPTILTGSQPVLSPCFRVRCSS